MCYRICTSAILGFITASIAAAQPAEKEWQKRAVLQGHTRPINCVAISPDGKTVVTGSYTFAKRLIGEMRVWDPVKKEERFKLLLHTDLIDAVAISPDGKTLACGCGSSSAGGKIILWNLDDARLVAELQCDDHRGTSGLVFTPDGKSLISSSPRSNAAIVVWDLAERKSRHVL